MAYIGKALVGILNENKVVDSMTGDGSDTTLTLSRTPGSVNNVEVFIDGIYQTPDVEYTLAGDTITFTTAPVSSVKVVAVSGNDSTIIVPASGSITAAKIAANAITGAKITSMSASKLSGALPALDGSALTGLPAANLTGALPAISGAALTGLAGVTKSASDPASDTNPSGGLGQLFLNTTSGEMYACTDATTDANVWTNVGSGDGDIQSYSYAGTIAGYSMGGNGTNAIDKYTFASDGDAAATGGTLTTNNFYHASQSVQSSTAGYIMGGYGAPYFNKIEKFVFATSSNATNVGSITGTANGVAGCNDTTHGYRAAGWTGGGTGFNIIERFAFATDGACADVGDLIASGHGCSSSSTETHGYITGAQASPNTAVQKFAFASSANAVDTTQDLINYRDYAGSATNGTHGFSMGGNRTTVRIDVESYAFASSAVMSDIGDMYTSVHSCSSSSSQTHGYCAGNGIGSTKAIQKIQLSSSATGTSVGNLISSKYESSGCFQ